MTEEQKIVECEICGKQDVVVTASGYHVAFVCVIIENMFLEKLE